MASEFEAAKTVQSLLIQPIHQPRPASPSKLSTCPQPKSAETSSTYPPLQTALCSSSSET